MIYIKVLKIVHFFNSIQVAQFNPICFVQHFIIKKKKRQVKLKGVFYMLYNLCAGSSIVVRKNLTEEEAVELAEAMDWTLISHGQSLTLYLLPA